MTDTVNDEWLKIYVFINFTLAPSMYFRSNFIEEFV